MSRDLKHGQPVKIEAHVEDDEGAQYRGLRGTVLGSNAVGEHSAGGRAVNVQLEDGRCVTVPVKAIRR